MGRLRALWLRFKAWLFPPKSDPSVSGFSLERAEQAEEAEMEALEQTLLDITTRRLDPWERTLRDAKDGEPDERDK